MICCLPFLRGNACADFKQYGNFFSDKGLLKVGTD